MNRVEKSCYSVYANRGATRGEETSGGAPSRFEASDRGERTDGWKTGREIRSASQDQADGRYDRVERDVEVSKTETAQSSGVNKFKVSASLDSDIRKELLALRNAESPAEVQKIISDITRKLLSVQSAASMDPEIDRSKAALATRKIKKGLASGRRKLKHLNEEAVMARKLINAERRKEEKRAQTIHRTLQQQKANRRRREWEDIRRQLNDKSGEDSKSGAAQVPGIGASADLPVGADIPIDLPVDVALMDAGAADGSTGE